MIKSVKVKHLFAPQFENLRKEDFIKFCADHHPQVFDTLPPGRELDALPR